MSQDDRPAHQFGERGPRDYNAAGTGILAQYFHSLGQGFQLPGIKSTWELHAELLEQLRRVDVRAAFKTAANEWPDHLDRMELPVTATR
jgi:hypothetical protein